ncbi:hypothetical protein H4R33_002915 [Dimargaris cristalligena]|uniref:Peptide hydrolase n=1 Tax=Dimargaris cristalligena TaxID=215637 RepID=A0A4P9ZSZ4_9FUNG|nr:hypothetical protein H4R33_002915 [Dimargaris cristalligena]RKP36318.1 hypothetical protein BJ085DRAFT_29594 [Dimargaris cristalligena]|eukprot:RKP36318.1 hypothetical protein BJ085DRAFT_29594 [Dimargaris cristalligena]
MRRFTTLCSSLLALLQLLLVLHLVAQVAADLITALTDQEIEELALLSKPERLEPDGEFLAPFLVKRVPGTEGNRQVQKFILEQGKKLGWFIETDSFTQDTPMGSIDFTNIILTKHPQAPARLVLAAHFDSKYFAPGPADFIGATDSAVPCALLFDLAFSLDHYLDQFTDPYTTVQLIFFDGEEAFVGADPNDFIWGSKHLAAYWERPTLFPATPSAVPYKTPLEHIDLMVLLDLIGAPAPIFNDYFANTSDYFHALAGLESRLIKLFLVSRHKSYFKTDRQFVGGIIDDHVPFVQRNIPVLHLIPHPFPKVWHTTKDDADALDHLVIHDFSILMRVFVASYLKAHPTPAPSISKMSPRLR